MEKRIELTKRICKNCGSSVIGEYCQDCGQRMLDDSDRSLRNLLGEILSNVFIFDNRFFLSLWYLFRYPGKMTVEYLAGKRKKFIPPITLFLFFNLIYFFVNPLSDYSLDLYDQMYAQLHSSWTLPLVEAKIESEGLDFESYYPIYQSASDNASKSIMILNVPIVAFFIYLMSLKKRKFYFDSLIFAFHYFSIYLFSWLQFGWVELVASITTIDYDSTFTIFIFRLLTLGIPIFFSVLSIKKFLDTNWYWAILSGIGAFLAVALANLIYRPIILLVVIWLS